MTIRLSTERLAAVPLYVVHRALDRPPATDPDEGSDHRYERTMLDRQPGDYSYRLTRGRATILVHHRRTSSTSWETETESRAGTRLRLRSTTVVTLVAEGPRTRIQWALTLEGIPWSQRLFLRLRPRRMARLLDSEVDRLLADLGAAPSTHRDARDPSDPPAELAGGVARAGPGAPARPR